MGIEVAIKRILGKRKLSRNQLPENQTGPIQELQKIGNFEMAAFALNEAPRLKRRSL